MNTNPLDEILQTEREVAEAIAAANEQAAAAVAEARRQADQLVKEAGDRGAATAERRYTEGLARARDEGDHIRNSVDERVAALRRQAEAHLTSAVDLVMETVLSSHRSD